METEIIGKETLLNAARFLVEGGHVAVPTETVYGLACNGLNRRAVQNLYEIKGRPAVRPISLMVSGPQAMDQYCRSVPQAARLLGLSRPTLLARMEKYGLKIETRISDE